MIEARSAPPDFADNDLVGDRIETRRIYLFPEMEGWFDWPYLSQGLAVEKITERKCTGNPTREVFFALTSLPKTTPPKELLACFRNHWSIENKVHHVLDCSMGEDACRMRAGCGAEGRRVLSRKLDKYVNAFEDRTLKELWIILTTLGKQRQNTFTQLAKDKDLTRHIRLMTLDFINQRPINPVVKTLSEVFKVSHNLENVSNKTVN